MKKALFALAIAALPASVFAQQDDSLFLRRLADEVLENSGAYENLRFLTKKIGGRLAGSPQMVQAEQWGLKAMQAAGPDRAYMQECMVPHWVRGGKDQAFVQAGKTKKQLDVVALGNTIGSAKPITAEVVAIANFDELEAKKDQLKGKIVYYTYPFNRKMVRTFQAYGDASKYRREGPTRAAQYGAVAAIVRSMSHGTNNHPHTGSTTYNEAYAKIPALAIGLQDADLLDSLARKGKTNVTVHTKGYFLPDTIGHNVIGELRGSQYPDQIITLGGHLDSWDNCEGAHDDGTGCVQTIEVLRAFKALGYQPRRTIRFVLFANEENGARGGAKYAEEAKAKGEKHVLALESDAGGFTPRGFGFTINGANQWNKIQAWAPLLAPYGGGELAQGGGGTDIAPLNRLMGTPLAGLVPDSQRYFDLHHARNDVFEAVNKRELDLGALNMAALVYLVDKYGL